MHVFTVLVHAAVALGNSSEAIKKLRLGTTRDVLVSKALTRKIKIFIQGGGPK